MGTSGGWGRMSDPMTCESIAGSTPDSSGSGLLRAEESKDLRGFLPSPSFAPPTLKVAVEKSKESVSAVHVYFPAEGGVMSDNQ